MSEQAAITDSPWFWVLVFSLVGILALGTISGQYGKRQARLEKQYQARERLNENSVADADRREFSEPDSTLVPLWPLAVVLCGVAIAAATMLRREQRRRRRELPG